MTSKTSLGVHARIPGPTILTVADQVQALNPYAWWKADAGVEKADGVPAEENDNIRNWVDQSGNGNTLQQVTALNQPVYSSDGDKLALLFDGAQQLRAGVLNTPLPAVREIFFVMSPNSYFEGRIFTDIEGSGYRINMRYDAKFDMYYTYALGPSGFDGAKRLVWIRPESGARSGMSVNTEEYLYTGGAGGADQTGLVMFLSSVPRCWFYEMLVTPELTDEQTTFVKSYLNNKYSVY